MSEVMAEGVKRRVVSAENLLSQAKSAKRKDTAWELIQDAIYDLTVAQRGLKQ